MKVGVSIDVTEKFVNEICFNVGHAKLHKLSANGHEPQLYGKCVDAPSGISVYNGEKLCITEAIEGVFRIMKDRR